MSMQLLEMVSDCSNNSAIQDITGASKKWWGKSALQEMTDAS